MTITLCYITSRKDPKIEWFFQTLAQYITECEHSLKLVIVDRWCEERDDWNIGELIKRRNSFRIKFDESGLKMQYLHVPPKPTVWAGKYRLTSTDYFAASNARNTGLCCAPDGYIVYVDDLSVVCSEWWNEVLNAVQGGYIACGSYIKVNNLSCVNGEVTFTKTTSGKDTRLLEIERRGQGSEHKIEHDGTWLYGCSVSIPVNALLAINGWDENADCIAGEDYLCGMALYKEGYKLYYVPDMMTLESDELHGVEPPTKRVIKKYPEGHTYPDCSHTMLHAARNATRIWNANYQDMKVTRDEVLKGELFPVIQVPEHHWVDGQPLREM